MNSNFEDEQFKAFLKKHQPVPPHAPSHQLDQLLSKLKLDGSSLGFGSSWFSLASAFVAIATIFVLFAVPKQNAPSFTSSKVSSRASVEEDYFDSELPTLEVASEYNQFIGSSELAK